jgi:hypothetical protein
MFIFLVQALNIDESLYLKILNISASKKTIAINRGSGDGLNINDHASFVVDEGIVAKGVLARISQYASLWQIYTIHQGDFLSKDKILNLKIIPPVKLTIDSTKQLVQDDISTGFDPKDPNPGKITLVEGADDLGSFDMLDEKRYQKKVGGNKDIFLLMNGNFTEKKNTSGETSASTSTSNKNYSIGGRIGFELGSKKNTDFFSKMTISFFGQGAYSYQDTQSDWKYQNNYGGGLSVALNFPHITETNQIIFYTSAGGVYLMGGKMLIDESISSLRSYGPLIGLGIKYYSSMGLGLKLGFEGYYLWNTEVLEDSTELKDQSIRLDFFAGISFRF